MQVCGDLLLDVLDTVAGVKIDHIPTLTWHEAMRLYGFNKPDLRIPLVSLRLTI